LSRYSSAQIYYLLQLVDQYGTASYSPLVPVDPTARLAFELRA